jgi:hypothetical protein
MNDFWNEPQYESPEDGPACPNPDCRIGVGTLVRETALVQTFVCDTCGQRWEHASAYLDPEWEADVDTADLEKLDADLEEMDEDSLDDISDDCPHVRPWELNDRLITSDLAYDAKRERETFRR